MRDLIEKSTECPFWCWHQKDFKEIEKKHRLKGNYLAPVEAEIEEEKAVEEQELEPLPETDLKKRMGLL